MYIQELGRVTATQPPHQPPTTHHPPPAKPHVSEFQTLTGKRTGASDKVSVLLLGRLGTSFSSFYHIKTGQFGRRTRVDFSSPFFLFFSQIFAAMYTFCFVRGWMGGWGGHTVFHFVRLSDRKITESTLAISVGHSGRFCYLSTGRLGPPG